MRRSLAIAAALALALTGGASTVTAQTRDSVTGTAFAEITLPPGFIVGVNFNFNASSGPLGESPTGTVEADGFFGGPISCLGVNGNQAVVGVPSTPTGGGVLIYVTDHGTPGPGLDTIGLVFTTSIPAACPAPGLHEDVAIFRGGLTVTDAPAFPTSKQQCKKAAWRDFPGFKNQGDCVSFVATRGTNPPAVP